MSRAFLDWKRELEARANGYVEARQAPGLEAERKFALNVEDMKVLHEMNDAFRDPPQHRRHWN